MVRQRYIAIHSEESYEDIAEHIDRGVREYVAEAVEDVSGMNRLRERLNNPREARQLYDEIIDPINEALAPNMGGARRRKCTRRAKRTKRAKRSKRAKCTKRNKHSKRHTKRQ
jgi:hypothetical protein